MNFNYYVPFLSIIARIGFIILFAYIATIAVGRLLKGLRSYTIRMRMKAGGETEEELQKRVETICNVVRKVMFVLVWVIAGIMILHELRFDIAPLIAGAGVIGVAIGFGAQNIVKDVLGGLFLLIENQIRVNDVAVINGKGGLVEELNLRTTVLRSDDGAVHIFANGSIQTISNLTREYSYSLFTVSVAYDVDTDAVGSILREIAEQLRNEAAFQAAILAPLEVMGVDQLGDNSVVLKARIRTLPGQQWMVGRELNRRIKQRFVEAQIGRGIPTQAVQILSPAMPELRDQVRQMVNETLDERAQAKKG